MRFQTRLKQHLPQCWKVCDLLSKMVTFSLSFFLWNCLPLCHFEQKNSANVKICEKIIQWLIDRSRLVINLGSHLRSASVQILFNYQWRHLLPFNEKLPIFNVSCSWLTFEANVRDINIERSKQFKWNLPIFLCVWAEPAILGSAKTALKLKYEI